MSAQHQESSVPRDVPEHTIPSTASLRRLLQSVLLLDADLVAFCLDNFPVVHTELSGGMTRGEKLNVLLSRVSASDIFAKLNEQHADAVAAYFKGELLHPGKVVTYRGKSSLDARDRRNRQRMLEKVRKFWIEGVLEKSLHGAVMLELDKEYRPDAVAYPWDMVLERPDTSPQLIPKGKRIIDLFDENLGELLILGAPGSGKTTMLLDLCRDLLTRANADEAEPIPVIFHLSSWAQQRAPLSEWLIDELFLRYDVAPLVGQEWLDNQRILPLLDGLDEVRHDAREQCMDSIAQLRKHMLAGLVIACRKIEYQKAHRRLQLHSAIELLPLTNEQVSAYLSSSTQPIARPSAMLASDNTFSEFMSSPFIVNTFLNAYNSGSFSLETITASDPTKSRTQIFRAFILNSIRRRRSLHAFPATKIFQYLSFIAKSMVRQSQTIFFL